MSERAGANDERKWPCMAFSDDFYCCNEREDHEGDHVARAWEREVKRWPR